MFGDTDTDLKNISDIQYPKSDQIRNKILIMATPIPVPINSTLFQQFPNPSPYKVVVNRDSHVSCVEIGNSPPITVIFSMENQYQTVNAKTNILFLRVYI